VSSDAHVEISPRDDDDADECSLKNDRSLFHFLVGPRYMQTGTVHQIFCSTGVDNKVDVGMCVHGWLMSPAHRDARKSCDAIVK
jgi:hypothetical protein